MTPLSHEEEYRVTLGDTDAAGVVFYPNYYRWFDRMTRELFRAAGQPLEAYWRQGYAPVLVDTQCSFLVPVRYGDVIRLRVHISEVHEHSFRVDHEIQLGEEIAARGHGVRAWMRIDGPTVGRAALPIALKDALMK